MEYFCNTEGNYIYNNQHDCDTDVVKGSQKLHKIGYRNTGKGEICALMIRRAMMIRKRIIGMIQIFLELAARTNSCFIEVNIMRIII